MRRLFFIGVFLALAYVLIARDALLKEKNGDSFHGKTLQFWIFGDPEEIFDPLIEEYEAYHPDVRVRVRSFDSEKQYRIELSQALQKRAGPDLMVVVPDDFFKLKPFLFPKKTMEARQAGNFNVYPEITKQMFGTNGNSYTLPWWADTLFLFYHKKYYPFGVSSSWDQFAEQTRTLTIGGIALGRFDNLLLAWDLFKALLIQKTDQLKIGESDSVWSETMKFFLRFADEKDRFFNWSETLTRFGPDLEKESFARQQVAAIGGFLSDYESLLEKIKVLKKTVGRNIIDPDEIGFAPFPQFDPKTPKHLTKFYSLGVSLRSRFPIEAWDFILFLDQNENRKKFEFATGKISAKILPGRSSDHPLLSLQRELMKNAGYVWIDEVLK